MTTDAETSPTPPPASNHIGERLRAAREAAGKSLAEIADQTKVPIRMLDAMERGAVSELPTGPYATGFARTYARAVGLDETQAVTDMRALVQTQTAGTVAAMTYYEPADADRVPPSRLAWIAGGIALLLIAAYILWRTLAGTPDVEPASPAPSEAASTDAAAAPAEPEEPAAPAITIAADAPLRIAASEQVWFSLTDANGRGQFDLTLNAGEYYTVKPGQRGLFLRTGRPQALRLIAGDLSLPQLGPADTIVSGIGLDAASLSRLASNPPATTATPATTPPATGATPAATTRP